MGVGVVCNNDKAPEGEELLNACQKLVDDSQELRRIAGLNVVRAAHIADVNGDDEVAQLLVSEASVMLSIASQIEWLFCTEPNTDVNL